MALNLTLDKLITIHHVQLPVMQQYEHETYYDQNGRVVLYCELAKVADLPQER